MQFITRLSSFFSARILRLTLVGLLAFLLLGPIGFRDHSITYTGGVSMAWAEDAKKDKNATDEMVENMVAFLNIILGVLTFLITPLVMLAGWLLSPDWTFGEIFGLRVVFHNIWILISNVVYVIFAFILVTIAFMNIFWGGHDHAYEIKQALPKLVVSILIVPFTWFIVSAVLSIANVLTASVIQLPVDMLSQTTNGSDILSQKIIPKNITYNHNVATATGTKNSDQAGPENPYVSTNGAFTASNCDTEEWRADCLTLKEFLTSSNGGAYNLVSAYAYGIFQIQKYKEIKDTELKWLKTTWDIVKKLIFWALFFIVFGILVIAIVYALFSRALMLWGFAMFSPLFALNYFFEHVKMGEKAKKSIEQFTISKFISLALVPVYVAAALAFGLMFVGSVVNMKTTEWNSIAQIASNDDTTTFTFGEVSLKTIGLLSGADMQNAKGVLQVGGNIIGTIIVNVLALVILWMAVMAALSADDITKAAVQPIASMGDELGKLMKSAPQYIPIMPSGAGPQSMASMAQAGKSVTQSIQSQAINKGNELGQKWMSPGYADQAKAVEGIKRAYQQSDFEKFKSSMHDLIRKDGVSWAAANAPFREFMAAIAKDAGITYEGGKEITATSLSDKVNLSKALSRLDHEIANNGAKKNWAGKDLFSKVTNKDNADSADIEASIERGVQKGISRVAAKSGGSTKDITVNIGGSDTRITLESNTVLAREAGKTKITDPDIAKLKPVIKDMDKQSARAKLTEIFDDTQVNIDDLYEKLK